MSLKLYLNRPEAIKLDQIKLKRRQYNIKYRASEKGRAATERAKLNRQAKVALTKAQAKIDAANQREDRAEQQAVLANQLSADAAWNAEKAKSSEEPQPATPPYWQEYDCYATQPNTPDVIEDSTDSS